MSINNLLDIKKSYLYTDQNIVFEQLYMFPITLENVLSACDIYQKKTPFLFWN